MKLEPPFRFEGRVVIHGKNGERFEGDGANITEVDSDGYIRMDIRPVSRTGNAQVTHGESIGVVVAKSRRYEIFSTAKEFRVVSYGPEGSRVVNKQIAHLFLSKVFTEISKEPAVRFNDIRRGLGQGCKDSLQLKAALAILENAACVECVREGKFAYYRKIKEWSLTLFQ
jgi:hypothetical protein